MTFNSWQVLDVLCTAERLSGRKMMNKMRANFRARIFPPQLIYFWQEIREIYARAKYVTPCLFFFS